MKMVHCSHTTDRTSGWKARLHNAVAAMLAVFACSVVVAAPITAEQARKGMTKWVDAKPAAHMNAKLHSVESVRTVSGDDGAELFHVVSLENGGYIVTPADDRIMPVIAFSDSGTVVEDKHNPLWVMLNLDLPKRMASFASAQAATNAISANGLLKASSTLDNNATKAQAEWEDLLSDDNTVLPSRLQSSSGVSSVSDVRVPILLTTKWGQSTDTAGNLCYNLYTPSNYVCGCVATAAAQLMRKHCYPTASVSARTYDCWVDSTAVSKTMMGGVYDWSNMPATPGSSSTEAQRQAIGKLCHDIGVAARMNWTSSGSGAIEALTANAYVTAFGYASAKCYISSSLNSTQMKSAIFANLDGGYPVVLAIKDSSFENGHAVVADGYGYYNSTIYTHLNLGWTGGSDAWYALPDIGTGYDFSIVSTVVYNVFPDETGDLLTGRVTNGSGSPIANAKVTVSKSSDSTVKTVLTDARGIYAAHVTGGSTWNVKASATGYESSSSKSVSVTESVSTIITEVTSSNCFYQFNGVVGNSWGNDITLTAASLSYTVTYAPGSNGTGSQVTATKTHGTALTLKGAIFAREGYVQIGWATADGGAKAYELGASYTGNAAITLYPVWTDIYPDGTYTNTVDGVAWMFTVSGGKATLGMGFFERAIATSTSGDLVIPSTLGGRPVACIGSRAFYYCTKLTSVTIPPGVTSIGSWAFNNCTKLTSVTIPSSVTSIDSFAFEYCTGLTSVTIPSSVTSISMSVFYGCSGLTSVTIQSGVTSIGSYAFAYCRGLTRVTIPSSVTRIGSYAFAYCSGLASVTIPSSVTSIGQMAFGECNSMSSIVVNAANQYYASVDGVLYNKAITTLVACPGGKTSVTIPSSVTSIGSYAFSGCRGLTSVEIPSSVTSIDDGAFSKCSGLTSVTIPSSVTSIGSYAFYDCSGLTSVTIPSSVTNIGSLAFAYCSGLASVTIPHGVTSIGYRAFYGCSSLATVYVDAGDVSRVQTLLTNSGFTTSGLTFIETYRVTYDPGSNGKGTQQTAVKTNGVDMVLAGAIFTREGYVQTGWAISDDGAKAYELGASYAGNAAITLYPAWTPAGGEPIPALPDNPTAADVAEALAGAADADLGKHITTPEKYNAFREWAAKVKDSGGAAAAGLQAVQNAPHAWLSYALDSTTLIENTPTADDVAVEAFTPSAESGKFDFTVAVDGVTVGSDALKENLKQVFGLEGATSLDSNGFSSSNVEIDFGTPKDGKVKFTAGPSGGCSNAKMFFMKVKMMQ